MDNQRTKVIEISITEHELNLIKQIVDEYLYFATNETDIGIYNGTINLEELTILSYKLR